MSETSESHNDDAAGPEPEPATSAASVTPAVNATAESAGVPVDAVEAARAAEVRALEARVSTVEAAVENLRSDSYKDRIINLNVAKIADLEKRVAAARDARATAMLHYDLVADLVREYRAAAAQDSASPKSEVLSDMEAVRSDLESHLLSLSMQPYGTDGGDIGSDARIVLTSQRAVAVENTDDADQDYVVVRAVRAGFRDLDGGIVRKQDVVIRRYREATVSK